MHLFKPNHPYFVGDCMPFYHDGVYHIYYLLDENHHQGKGGLGGHQWAHASSSDLAHWIHHPLALPISEDWEGSICTGSVFYHQRIYHAFYATRRPDWTQHLSHATSSDGVHFMKEPAPLVYPPQCFSRFHFRDPFVFEDDDGRFQMLVTAQIEPFALHERGGCLLRLSSADLREWQVEGPFLIPGGQPGYACIPECADLFVLNGIYYLLFGLQLQTHYRMARSLSGPWLRPAVDTFDNRMLAVMKTAPFGPTRRIGAAWVPTRKDDRDSGDILWGGNITLREIIQLPNGELGTAFVRESLPALGDVIYPEYSALTSGASGDANCIRLNAAQTQEAAALSNLPQDYFLRCRVVPAQDAPRYSLGLRGVGALANHAALTFDTPLAKILLTSEQIEQVDGLDSPFTLEVIVKDDVIDVCVNGSRCIINRLPEQKGARLFFTCESGSVSFDEIEIRPV